MAGYRSERPGNDDSSRHRGNHFPGESCDRYLSIRRRDDDHGHLFSPRANHGVGV